MAGLSERDEITKKNVSKLFSRVDELDEKVEQVMSGFGFILSVAVYVSCVDRICISYTL